MGFVSFEQARLCMLIGYVVFLESKLLSCFASDRPKSDQ